MFLRRLCTSAQTFSIQLKLTQIGRVWWPIFQIIWTKPSKSNTHKDLGVGERHLAEGEVTHTAAPSESREHVSLREEADLLLANKVHVAVLHKLAPKSARMAMIFVKQPAIHKALKYRGGTRSCSIVLVYEDLGGVDVPIL